MTGLLPIKVVEIGIQYYLGELKLCALVRQKVVFDLRDQKV